MNVMLQLNINNHVSITFSVPNRAEDKLNYYYFPTDQLNLFDQATVILQKNDTAVELSQQSIDLTIGSLHFILKKIINNENLLPDEYAIGDLARIYNMDIYNEKIYFFNLSSFTPWNNTTTITLLYSQKNKIYLDISPLYPWLYTDLEKSKETTPFEDFIKNYKPIALYEISTDTAHQWLVQCTTVLDEIAILSGYKNYADSTMMPS